MSIPKIDLVSVQPSFRAGKDETIEQQPTPETTPQEKSDHKVRNWSIGLGAAATLISLGVLGRKGHLGEGIQKLLGGAAKKSGNVGEAGAKAGEEAAAGAGKGVKAGEETATAAGAKAGEGTATGVGKEAETATAKEAETATVKEAENAATKEVETATVKEVETATAKEAENAATIEAETATVKEAETATAKEAEAATVKEAEAATAKEAENAATIEAETATVKEAEAATVKETENAATKEAEKAAEKEAKAAAQKAYDAEMKEKFTPLAKELIKSKEKELGKEAIESVRAYNIAETRGFLHLSQDGAVTTLKDGTQVITYKPLGENTVYEYLSKDGVKLNSINVIKNGSPEYSIKFYRINQHLAPVDIHSLKTGEHMAFATENGQARLAEWASGDPLAERTLTTIIPGSTGYHVYYGGDSSKAVGANSFLLRY